MRQRRKLVPRAKGRVLEVGFGSGLNLGFYRARAVERIWALDPSREMLDLARERIRSTGLPVRDLAASAEAVPLDDDSIDTVLVTYTLCTLPDPPAAFAEMRRVLCPGGELLFCEHAAAPDPGVRRWQDRLNPVWKRLGGGCNLNRDIPALIESNGFSIGELEQRYIPGWRPASFNVWGVAVPA